jgi:hypothetical protein
MLQQTLKSTNTILGTPGTTAKVKSAQGFLRQKHCTAAETNNE